MSAAREEMNEKSTHRGLAIQGRHILLCITAVSAFFLVQVTCAFGQTSAAPPPSGPGAGELAAANQGNVQAQLSIAKAFNEGTYGRRNYAQAFQWFQSASQQGSTEASAWLGSLYLEGHGVAQDLTRASTLIQSAAQQNNAVGLRFLGILYETGQGVPRDYSKAAASFSKATAQQDANAFDHLGLLYMHGLGVKQNLQRAVHLLTRGSRLGDSWAQLHLGELYLSGHVPAAKDAPGSVASGSESASQDALTMAFKLFSDSAEQNNRVAAFKLGEMYAKGQGTAKDYQKALDLYVQSASSAYGPAELALGRAAEQGLGTSVDLVSAYTWYSLAADRNDPQASTLLRNLSTKMTLDQVHQAETVAASVEQQRAKN